MYCCALTSVAKTTAISNTWVYKFSGYLKALESVEVADLYANANIHEAKQCIEGYHFYIEGCIKNLDKRARLLRSAIASARGSGDEGQWRGCLRLETPANNVCWNCAANYWLRANISLFLTSYERLYRCFLRATSDCIAVSYELRAIVSLSRVATSDCIAVVHLEAIVSLGLASYKRDSRWATCKQYSTEAFSSQPHAGNPCESDRI